MPHAGHSRPQQCSAIVRRTRDALANPDAEGGLAHANVHCRQQRILLSVVKSRTAQERGGGLVPDRRPSSSFRPASRPAPAVGVELHLAQTSASRLQRCRGGKKPRNRRSKAQAPACREPQGHRDEVAVQGFGKKSSEDAAPTAPAVRGSAEPRRPPPTTACRRAVRATRSIRSAQPSMRQGRGLRFRGTARRDVSCAGRRPPEECRSRRRRASSPPCPQPSLRPPPPPPPPLLPRGRTSTCATRCSSPRSPMGSPAAVAPAAPRMATPPPALSGTGRSRCNSDAFQG